MAIFSFESKSAQFLGRLWNMFVLNLLWVLGSLPILTVGVSTIAAYSVTLKMVEDEDGGSVVGPFFRAYRENFRQGMAVSVLFVVFTAAVVLDFFLFEAVEGNPVFLSVIGILTAALVLMHFLFAFPLIARYRNTVFQHLTNARQIFIRFFVRTLACLLLLGLEVWIILFNGMLLLYIGFFVAPVLAILIVSAFVVRFFREIEKEGGVLSAADAGGADGCLHGDATTDDGR